MVDRKETPLPPADYAPAQFAVADWINLSANSSTSMLEVNRFGDHAIDVRRVGGRPEDNVQINVETVRQTGDGRQTETDTYDSTAFYSFGNPGDAGPFATDRFEWRARNRSSTDYTQGGNGAYQAYINYVIRRMSVVEKLRRDVPLDNGNDDGEEHRLAREFGLLDREDAGLPQEIPPYLQPTLEDKTIRERESAVATVDVPSTGLSSGTEIASVSNLEGDDLVAYVTGLQINSQEFADTDNLKVVFERSGNDAFYHLETYGLPGFSDDSFEADLFVPFIDDMTVSVWLDNNSNSTVTGVDVNLEYALVERTVLEKALYGLRHEAEIVELYDEVNRQIRAGVPIALDLGDY